MNYRNLGGTGLKVSELGFGALEIGRDWAADVNANPQHLSAEEAAAVLNGVLDKGVNFIDTAPAYWYSEEFIGKALKSRRNDYILATKVGEHCDREGSYYDYSAAASATFIDRSLQRLQTDVIDLIQIHSASLEILERGETWSTMDAARQAGKVRHIGMTGNVDAAIRAVEIGGYDTVQVPFNLLDCAALDTLFPMCIRANVGVIIMRGLAGGKLTSKYNHLQDEQLKARISKMETAAKTLYPDSCTPLSRAALRYLMSQAAISTAIIGTRRLAAVDSNLNELSEPISEAEKTAFQAMVSAE